MKKHFKFFIALIALVSMFTVTAYAKATPFNISKDDGNQYITDNTKDRTDNVWLITISTSTPPSYTDWWPFTPNVDVVGYRVRKYAGWGVSSTAMSNYHTFTNYVTNYQFNVNHLRGIRSYFSYCDRTSYHEEQKAWEQICQV